MVSGQSDRRRTTRLANKLQGSSPTINLQDHTKARRTATSAVAAAAVVVAAAAARTVLSVLRQQRWAAHNNSSRLLGAEREVNLRQQEKPEATRPRQQRRRQRQRQQPVATAIQREEVEGSLRGLIRRRGFQREPMDQRQRHRDTDQLALCHARIRTISTVVTSSWRPEGHTLEIPVWVAAAARSSSEGG